MAKYNKIRDLKVFKTNIWSFCQKILENVHSNVPHFSIKNESVIILKGTNFWRENLAIFHDVKKPKIYIPYHKFVSYIC